MGEGYTGSLGLADASYYTHTHTHVYIYVCVCMYPNHFVVHEKLTQHCQWTILQ